MISNAVLVTGAMGFVGRNLMQSIKQQTGVLPLGTSLKDHPNFSTCDLGSACQVKQLLQELSPSQIYHCVGSFTNSWDTDFKANLLTTQNILQAALELKLKSRILLIGSAAEYGVVNPVAVPETAALRPVSIYGLTKLYQTELMNYYHRQYGLDIVMGRIFNLYGEGCSPLLLPGKVLDQVRLIKAGLVPKICVGSLHGKRDFLPVQLAVDYLIKIMAYGIKGEIYNVASGIPIGLRDFLARLLEEHGLTTDVIEESPSQNDNKSEVSEIFADISKLKSLSALADGSS